MKIIGHRGARGLAPENTLAAIEAGIDAGADIIEIDIRLTSDGQPVLIHDKTLARLTGQPLAVKSHTLAELRGVKPDLAVLPEALSLINRRRPLIIEVKPAVPVEPVIAEVRQALKTGGKPEDFFFASFSQKTLRALHAALPEVPVIVNERFISIRGRWRAHRLGTKLICMNKIGLWPGFIYAMQHGGYRLNTYTLNDAPRAHRWAGNGLHGVVTDYPDRFKSPVES